MKNTDPDILNFLWQSIYLLINVRDPPDKKFFFHLSTTIYIKLSPLKGKKGVSGHIPITSTSLKFPIPQFVTQKVNKYETLQKGNYI